MPLEIVGAGMAGLLAANMLRHRQPFITEVQPSLPNNHSAVLRFRTSVVSDVLNIPFRKVTMIKTALPYKNPIADALAYSFKNTGYYRSDRSIIAGLVADDRYIAPPDLISQMAKEVEIIFDVSFKPEEAKKPVISTLPMPVLMEMLAYENKPTFNIQTGLNVRCRIRNCDAYVSILVPDPGEAVSRISITGDELIAEVPNFNFSTKIDDQFMGLLARNNVDSALRLLGIPLDAIVEGSVSWHKQKYAKIMPIDDDVRKDFIYWATDQHGIFSLGRFATWRPGLLLDDLVQDIRLIDKWLSTKHRYAVARHR